MTLKIILFFLICSYAANSQTDFGITGKIKGIENGSMIFLVNNAEGDTLAITRIKNEKFAFRGNLKAVPEWYSLRIKGLKNWPDIFLGNENIAIEGSITDWDMDNVKIFGSLLNDEVRQLRQLDKPIINLYDSLIYTNGSQISFQKQKEILIDSQLKIWNVFIDQHSNSAYTPWLILNTSQFNDSIKEAKYNRLSAAVKNSNYGIKLKGEIERGKIRATIKPGSIAPNFWSKTTDGDTLYLHNVIKQGKLTLVDFWASWCMPCRQEIPNIKKIYEEFHEKGFNVLSIALENRKAQWLDALEKEKMPWFQVSQVKGREEEANLLYGFNTIPASLLVDKNGEIIAIDATSAEIPTERGCLRGEALFKKVEEILGKKEY